ncbi:hypothetical protein RHSIM_Rhsim08G0127600 [Rhododendron simsii]|uniref:Uncharacterized protein n=1 Tax=Rhododendron simsii TaxID=118357 RepID=A0A834LJT4_RHOSS|nr:hypothetical protein RHSIM_Rhsim08G0127600 [Rhododendron simsii]
MHIPVLEGGRHALSSIDLNLVTIGTALHGNCSRVLLESPFGWQWYLGERVTRQSLGLAEFRVPAGVPLFMLRTGDYTREEIERHTRPVEDLTAYLSPSLDYAGYRERYLAYRLRMVERLSGAMEVGGNESEAATGASGSRGSRRGGAGSRRRSSRGRGTGQVAEAGHTFPEVSRVVSVVTREGIEGEIAIPSRSASITLPEAEVPRAWAENVYRLLLDCFTVIRQGAMGVSPEVLPRGATAAAQRGGARRRSSSGGATVREGGREESSSRGGGRGEATSRGGGQGEAISRGRGVWVTRQPGAIHRPRTKNARSSPPPVQSTSTQERVPVNPFKKIGIAQTLSEKLGISKNAAKSLTEGGMLNIPRLINQFRGNRNRVHETQGFVRRNFVEACGSEELWVHRFHQVTEEMIAWRTNWADLPVMALSNMGRSRMMLAGMFGWTFYIPYRILRQLGVRQTMPPHEYFIMPPFKFSTCRFYQHTWRARVTIPRDPYPSVLLPQNYENWLIQDIEARIGWNED